MAFKMRANLFVDNAGKLEAVVESNPEMKRSALETVDLSRDAAATGAAQGRELGGGGQGART